MRVAVIFFGVARSVSMTIESIKSHIYACNPADAFSFYTIASLNMVESISNPRTGEDGISLNSADAFLLNADAYTLIRQDDQAITEAFSAARLQPDYFGNNWISVKNSLHQLASLQRAWHLSLDILHGDFDYFLFVRPDLIYHNEIKLNDILNKFHGRGNIALPAWHSWGGFNDRFALADATAARYYAARLSLVPEYCAEKFFHPERLLAYALEKGQCRVCKLPVTASRVRANSAINSENFSATITEIPFNSRPFFIESGQVVFKEVEMVMESNNETAAVVTKPEHEMVESPPVSAPLRLGRATVDGYDRVSPLDGLYYLDFLKALHTERQVKRYLEIGTQTGMSLGLARGEAVAIDPDFKLDKKTWLKKPGIHLFEVTSDEFFAAHNPCDIFGNTIDLAFIDGMHWSEFVLRDFNNVEKYCSKDSVIVLHDAIPQNFEMTERDRRPEARHDKPLAYSWTGDVWRVVPLLARERPDLCIQVLDCPPTGLVLISNLDPEYRMPSGQLEALTHSLSDAELPESEFWLFIESLAVVDSRKYFPGMVSEKTPDRSWIARILDRFR